MELAHYFPRRRSHLGGFPRKGVAIKKFESRKSPKEDGHVGIVVPHKTLLMLTRLLFIAVAVEAYTIAPAARPAAAAARCAAVHASAGAPFKVGVLAIQGGFAEHMQALARYKGVEGVEVRTPKELATVDAIILPGGESTAIGYGLVDAKLLEPLQKFVKSKPAWGVCAGLILLAQDLDDGAAQPLLGGLDISVKRNAFGRQSKSAFRPMEVSNSAANCGDKAYFIRAPAVTKVRNGVEILAQVAADDEVPELGDSGAVVAVRQNKLMATCFHPEISSDDSWLELFLKDVCQVKDVSKVAAVPDFSVAAPWIAAPALGMGYGSTAAKRAFAVFQKGGVIMDVVDGHQARIAEAAGAVAVMALERIPADIKADGGVARSSDPAMIIDVMNSCSIPVMAKSRIGHFYEAKILEALDVDCIDESEVLTAADEAHHIDKRSFGIPFVCGAQDLGEALRRISEGAAMIRLKGNAGTGNVIQAVRHARAVFSEIRKLSTMRDDELFAYAKELRVPFELVQQTKDAGRLPVVTFAAGGLATPADVALLMELGCDGVFVGSGIFKGENPAQRARAMVNACTHYKNPLTVARVSTGLGKAMVGLLENEPGSYVTDKLTLKGRVGVDPGVAA